MGRTCTPEINELFSEAVSIDIDFSENLSVPLKFEPQSMHWCHKQVTVHSGILKMNGEKSYHPYLSDDIKHDNVLVDTALREMTVSIEPGQGQTLLINSDNCTCQYKCAPHLVKLQSLSDTLQTVIIRIWSIAG